MSNTLTKQDIVRTLAEKYRLQYSDTRRVVQGMLDMVIDALMDGKKVELRNFGVFEVVERAGRVARNPKHNTELTIPARNVVRFRQGRIMDQEITNPSMKGKIAVRKPATEAAPANEPPRTPDQGPA